MFGAGSLRSQVTRNFKNNWTMLCVGFGVENGPKFGQKTDMSFSEG